MISKSDYILLRLRKEHGTELSSEELLSIDEYELAYNSIVQFQEDLIGPTASNPDREYIYLMMKILDRVVKGESPEPEDAGLLNTAVRSIEGSGLVNVILEREN